MLRSLPVAAALAALSACTLHDQAAAPPLTGPSGNAITLTVTVSPDILTQDGASQSVVSIAAFGPNGQPLASLPLRAEILAGGASTDFGTLSARNLVTDGSGRATLIYTAPPPPTINVDQGTIVAVSVTALSTDYANNNPIQATIRLVPPGVVGPGNSPLRPEFSVPTATVGNQTVFQATVTDPSGADATAQVISYVWSFGDGGTATGRNVTHTYTTPGTFPVSLTITDTLGRSQRVTHTLTAGQGQLPIASFTASPSSPAIHQTINFNASGSTAEPGHVITTYAWDFGDGTTGGGQVTTHSYSTAGTYIVSLQVFDDAGRKSALTTQTISVGVNGPTAQFTSTPAAPLVGQTVNFNASQSKAGAGRTLVSYAWDFGDGTSGSGVTTSHVYSAVGTYTVTLTVTDNAGQTAIATGSVSVGNGSPTAAFNYSPVSPTVGQTINFNASASSAQGGRTITNYAWNFGDGSTGTGVGPTHAYSVAGTYTVQLTVTDSAGQTGITTQNITVGSIGPPTASFTFSPQSPTVGQTVNFNGAGSTAQGGRTIVSYAWNFGDGNTGTGVTASHPYTVAGTYSVTLTVVDSGGQSATSSPQSVVVR